ncbi:MAG: hypothetical protein KH100_05985 [Dysgonomonas mossii]|uniref:hypothetical protein n=1 Tax=Dysgonomonas mossii TaxID=163665 RepID=UPI001DCD6E78|nr:hypothetical protein [Dysgonomonas mossii]MBS5797342.1 hypothetical protein [Dysgonomonas mossii]MBS7110736.1 hypothetical protein [Dysgonomonas mossii]
MSDFYIDENMEFASVLKARATRMELSEKNITPSDINTLFKLKIDRNTMMYFRSKEARQNFITNHRNRRSGKYDFMERLPLFEGERSK